MIWYTLATAHCSQFMDLPIGWRFACPGMVPFKPMGEENYNYLLANVYYLPIDAKQVEMLGQAELARYRALESLLPDPSLADPDPARSKNIPG